MFNLVEQAALGLSQAHLSDFQGRLVEHRIKRDLEQMVSAAKKSGITLTLASTFRDFERQSLIWNNKFNLIRPVFDINDNPVDMASLNDAEKCFAIMLFSAIPGASRHHFGTDMDVFDASKVADDYQLQLCQAEYSEHGPFCELSNWLANNAEKYGFFLPYKHFNGGVAKEPWHISHIERSEFYMNVHSEQLLVDALKQSNVAGWPTLVDQLDEIYPHFVTNITLAGS
ncbi:M15 family metallopeptidase [Pseudoalteromonas sp. G4]|uniref:M15 family metallopeptidase n=1 Tax=Pseudoalteromonas sp. G4 TaxID=2992761 RepID=UPI00237D404A|nr:M15 family metallopeptidase [Pseudoalteromonas sp. G4]MDE3272733.1 M15 family metallopeptidase [Pseudoalteromonas sp. G4]